MSVGRKEVEHIASLSRIPLGPDEADRLSEEMNRILEHADRLREAVSADEVAEEGVGEDPAPEEVGAESGMRAPEDVRPDALVRRVAGFAPRFEDSFFVVPPPQGVTAGDE